MVTMNQVCKQVVLDSISLEGYDAEQFQNIAQVYQAEYGYNGLSNKACRDYLQGLPSACTVPFMNHDILTMLAENGISRETEATQQRLIDHYWLYCGMALHEIIRRLK